LFLLLRSAHFCTILYDSDELVFMSHNIFSAPVLDVLIHDIDVVTAGLGR
jgi:hypothetical protein